MCLKESKTLLARSADHVSLAVLLKYVRRFRIGALRPLNLLFSEGKIADKFLHQFAEASNFVSGWLFKGTASIE